MGATHQRSRCHMSAAPWYAKCVLVCLLECVCSDNVGSHWGVYMCVYPTACVFPAYVLCIVQYTPCRYTQQGTASPHTGFSLAYVTSHSHMSHTDCVQQQFWGRFVLYSNQANMSTTLLWVCVVLIMHEIMSLWTICMLTMLTMCVHPHILCNHAHPHKHKWSFVHMHATPPIPFTRPHHSYPPQHQSPFPVDPQCHYQFQFFQLAFRRGVQGNRTRDQYYSLRFAVWISNPVKYECCIWKATDV